MGSGRERDGGHHGLDIAGPAALAREILRLPADREKRNNSIFSINAVDR